MPVDQVESSVNTSDHVLQTTEPTRDGDNPELAGTSSPVGTSLSSIDKKPPLPPKPSLVYKSPFPTNRRPRTHSCGDRRPLGSWTPIMGDRRQLENINSNRNETDGQVNNAEMIAEHSSPLLDEDDVFEMDFNTRLLQDREEVGVSYLQSPSKPARHMSLKGRPDSSTAYKAMLRNHQRIPSENCE